MEKAFDWLRKKGQVGAFWFWNPKPHPTSS